MIYVKLFWEFFKTGLFAVGGGMATLPFLQAIGENSGWYSYTDLMNMLAVSESTPGPIGINMATYVGFTVAGIPGAVTATIGEVTPSIIVILIVAAILNSFRDNKYVNRAFYGLRPASTGGDSGGPDDRTAGIAGRKPDKRSGASVRGRSSELGGAGLGGASSGADELGEAGKELASDCFYCVSRGNWSRIPFCGRISA